MLKPFKKLLFVSACSAITALALAIGGPAFAAAKKAPAKPVLATAKKQALAKQTATKQPTAKQPVAKNSAKPVLKTAAANARNATARARVVLAKNGKATRAVPVKMAYVNVRGKNGKIVRVARAVPAAHIVRVAHVPPEPPRLSFGQQAGLHHMQDELDLKSSVALVVDQDSKEVLFSKNDHAVLPIASITKLMTGLVISEAQLDMQEMLSITLEDVDTEKGSRSRLAVGTQLSRSELMHLALMSSENRAAHALGRTYPGGLNAFMAQMNARAKQLGMNDTRFAEPTGLSSRNQSSAHDLARLVGVAYHHTVLREYTTSTGYELPVGERTVRYNNTNGLVSNPEWEIGLQKTGFISEAGRCLVMQARVAGRKLIMVFLDSAGKFSRLGDAERVRRWVESQPVTQAVPQAQRVSSGSVGGAMGGGAGATIAAQPKS
jgi:serine-type D-Ala-D-Ala endopeptidase (penicillin-binding protein 7)